jgi:hypothetical protein
MAFQVSFAIQNNIDFGPLRRGQINDGRNDGRGAPVTIYRAHHGRVGRCFYNQMSPTTFWTMDAGIAALGAVSMFALRGPLGRALDPPLDTNAGN